MAATTSHWLACTTSHARLASLDSIIESSIDVTDVRFRELALHTTKKGGKKLRPSLYFLSVHTGDYYGTELLYPAAALELIHVASLYHDDVMDRAELRRNAISVNAKWGNVNTVYSGNYLFSKAISLLADYNISINQTTCKYISDLCLGQLKESENAYNITLTYEDHIAIIQKKTASLFELPCIIGATLGRADEDTIDALVRYSKHIGIAFQLIDDLLDLKGDPHKTGKRVGTDLKEGIYTYATLHALQSEVYKKELSDVLLMDNLTDAYVQKAIDMIKKSGGMAVARKKADEHIKIAIDAVSILPEDAIKKSLLNLAAFIISRDH